MNWLTKLVSRVMGGGPDIPCPMNDHEVILNPEWILDSDGVYKPREYTTLYDFQQKGVRRAIHRYQGRCLIGDEMGLGKAQPLNAQILTPCGWTTMGQIDIGDEVIGSNGKSTLVMGVFPQGEKKVFRVSFSDGTSTECCDDHLWEVNSPVRKHNKLKPKVLPLSKIRTRLKQKNGNNIHFIPMTAPVDFDHRVTRINPYLLGYLIANGSLTGNCTTVTIPDIETLTRLNQLTPMGVFLRPTSKKNPGIDYRAIGHQGVENRLTTKLREYGLMGHYSYQKFIPKSYLYNSLEVRESLLQGLMDGDGNVREKDNHIEYDTTSHRLALDVVELVQSLGGRAVISFKESPQYTHNDEKRTGRPSYRISIALPSEILPFRLSRKADVYHPRRKYPPTRAIVKVEFIGMKECQCIKVAAPNGLYLTNSYIVTHNTPQALFIGKVAGWFPMLVVCPATLKANWQKETKKHIGMRSVILESFSPPTDAVDRRRLMLSHEIFIINYDILLKPKAPLEESWFWFLQKMKFKYLVIDECHYLGNKDAKRTKIVTELSKSIPYIVALSGTPIPNEVREIWPTCHILRPDLYPSFFQFGIEYCKPSKIRGRWVFKGAKNLLQLNEELKTNLMIRRRKKDVLKELPVKARHIVPIALSKEAMKEYNHALNDFLGWLKRVDAGKVPAAARAEGLVKGGYLKRLVARLKLDSSLEWIDDLLHDTSGKTLVFAVQRNIVEKVRDRFKPMATILYGGMTSTQRETSEHRFKKDPSIRLMSGNLKAMGTGHNLTEADVTVTLELGWKPADHSQAEARIDRIGQKLPTSHYYLLAQDTIEEDICQIIQRKQGIADAALDGEETTQDMSLFDEFVKIMRKKIL